MKQLLTAFAKNTVFANISLIMILVAGALAAASMIRENFPEFSLDIITVSVAYPGADPEEVEEGVSRKIEEALEGIEGIKQVTTHSNENAAAATIEVKEGYPVSEVLDRVRSQIDAISTFPVDAEAPVITELTLKDPVVLLYLSGGMDERRLKEWSERIKDDLQQLPDITQVSVFGTRDYEIAVEVSEERLREYGLTFDQVTRAVRRSNLNLAGGTLRTRGEEIRLRTLGRKYTGAEMAKIVVLADPDGNIITLDRIARISDGFSEDPIQAFINGEPAVMLIVYKTRAEDSLAISRAVQRFVAEAGARLPAGAKLAVLYDNTEMLRSRINLLVKNGIIGLAIVFTLLWMFLNARLSLWAGMGIPISVAGALVLLWALGGSLNMISLFAFIMVLGIVVDDAIVVGEAIYFHRKAGQPPLAAAVAGVGEVGMPVIAAVTTTMVAFLPLIFVGGIMGKFIAVLPTVVIACLAVSLLECLFLLPAHLSHLPDLNRPEAAKDRLTRRLEAVQRVTQTGMAWCVDRLYLPLLNRALTWRYVSFCIALSVLMITAGLVEGGLLKFEVFPEIDGFVVTATVEMPEGTPPAVTREALGRVEAGLLRLAARTGTRSGDPLVADRLTLIGQTLEDPPRSGPHLGSAQAIFLDSERRGIHSRDLMVAWEREVGPIAGIKSLSFAGMAAGPPGAPIEVWLQGSRMPDILAAADALMARLRQFDGVYQIRSDFSAGKNEMRLRLKPEATVLGLTVDDLAGQVYAGYYGEEALRLQRGRDDIRVKVRYPEGERRRLADIEQIRIRTAGGREVPLRSVAEVRFSPGYATITRTDGMRRVAVSAGVDTDRANANEIFAELGAGFFPELMQRYPSVRVALQGEQKKMRESFSSLYIGFPLAVFGIFVIVATIFRSYLQPFVILFAIPFGIIGAVCGHLLLGYDLSIMSIFGMVALTGVVVNDAIVLIERVNTNLSEGMPFLEAIVQGGRRRFRAIILTTVSTIGGLAPIILETDFQAKFLIPMALSIAAGVAFATLLTLVLIPSLLVILNDLRRLPPRLLTGAWPPREAVEPAARRVVAEVPGLRPVGSAADGSAAAAGTSPDRGQGLPTGEAAAHKKEGVDAKR
jgi:multidrug efflux pump subunit AcrB